MIHGPSEAPASRSGRIVSRLFIRRTIHHARGAIPRVLASVGATLAVVFVEIIATERGGFVT